MIGGGLDGGNDPRMRVSENAVPKCRRSHVFVYRPRPKTRQPLAWLTKNGLPPTARKRARVSSPTRYVVQRFGKEGFDLTREIMDQS